MKRFILIGDSNYSRGYYAGLKKGFIAGAKWGNNELIEEVIVYLQKQFPEYGNREFSCTEIRKLLESLKIKP